MARKKKAVVEEPKCLGLMFSDEDAFCAGCADKALCKEDTNAHLVEVSRLDPYNFLRPMEVNVTTFSWEFDVLPLPVSEYSSVLYYEVHPFFLVGSGDPNLTLVLEAILQWQKRLLPLREISNILREKVGMAWQEAGDTATQVATFLLAAGILYPVGQLVPSLPARTPRVTETSSLPLFRTDSPLPPMSASPAGSTNTFAAPVKSAESSSPSLSAPSSPSTTPRPARRIRVGPQRKP